LADKYFSFKNTRIHDIEVTVDVSEYYVTPAEGRFFFFQRNQTVFY